MKTDNELIAEFMGVQNHNYYRNSWDFLMPVVNKIGEYTLQYPEQAKKVTQCKVIIKFDVLYSRCVDFINWYNSMTKEKTLDQIKNEVARDTFSSILSYDDVSDSDKLRLWPEIARRYAKVCCQEKYYTCSSRENSKITLL